MNKPMKRTGVVLRAAAVACLGGGGGSLFEGGGRELLAECSFNDECEAPMLCAARKCRVQCRGDRDCTNGWRRAQRAQHGLRVSERLHAGVRLRQPRVLGPVSLGLRLPPRAGYARPFTLIAPVEVHADVRTPHPSLRRSHRLTLP